MIKMNKKAYEICSKAKVSNDFARHEVPLVQLTDIQKDIEKMERYFRANSGFRIRRCNST